MAPNYQIDQNRKYSIAVVGGGIGGLCTTIGLLRQGVPVEVYEAAPSFAEIGAGVSLGPNASRAMQMIDPAIHKGFEHCATNNQWPTKANYWFSFRKGQNSDSDSANGTSVLDLWCSTGQTSVHRASYLDELVALVPDSIAHFGKRLEDVHDDGEKVLLKFSDGSTATHSAVIGCDGVKSRTRKIVLGADHPAATPQFSGKYAYRGLIPMSRATELLGAELAQNAQLYMGRGGHILTFPIEKGQTMNVVAFSTKADGKWEDDEWVKPMDRAGMERDFDGWVESTRRILSLMEKPDVWALFEHPPAPTYTKGRICMLGDAAHASTPHQGAGAGQAIEDALVMSRVMGMVYQSEDIQRAFAAFDKVRRPRSQRQVKTAREAGLLYDLQFPGIGEDWEKVKEQLKVRQDWIWDRDLELDVKEAVEAFQQPGTSRL
ncbi:hypothetical protein MBLNU230_g1349t1 [Neophaeotheca triangularis]